MIHGIEGENPAEESIAGTRIAVIGAGTMGAAMVRRLLAAGAIVDVRRGDLAAAFGPRFAGLGLRDPVRLPGGRMTLLNRITLLDPSGGRGWC